MQGNGVMIGGKLESQPWRGNAMVRNASSSESQSGSRKIPTVIEFKKAPTEAAAWDPYEVWLTRVKQPRDARDRK
jgi:hypothetical protein